jgi:hypothetical protein
MNPQKTFFIVPLPHLNRVARGRRVSRELQGPYLRHCVVFWSLFFYFNIPVCEHSHVQLQVVLRSATVSRALYLLIICFPL